MTSNIGKRILPLLCIFCLLSTALALPAYAVGSEENFNYKKIISEALDSYTDTANQQISGSLESLIATGEATADIIPGTSMCLAALVDAESGDILLISQVTYVEDTNSDGSTYLIGDYITGDAVAYGANGKKCALLAVTTDGLVALSLAYLDENNFCAFYTADQFFETVTPLKIGSNYSEDVEIHYLKMYSKDENTTVTKIEKLSLNLSGYGFSDTNLIGPLCTNENILGAPFVATNGDKVLGIVTGINTANNQMVMTNLYNCNLDNRFAVVKGRTDTTPVAEPTETSTPADDAPAAAPIDTTPATEPAEPVTPADDAPAAAEANEETKKFPVWIVIGAVFVVLALLKGRKSKKTPHEEKKQEANVQSPQNGTVILNDYPIPQPLNALWQIRGIDGTMDGKVFEIGSVLRFGRSPECNVVFPSNAPGISSVHCELEQQNGRIVLRDLQSSYGTYLAGNVRATPRVDYHLQEGDVFTLAQGGQTFRLERAGTPLHKKGPSVRAIAETKTYHADTSGRITFGRDMRCQIQFSENEYAISGKHCVLYRENNDLFLMDTNSTNGTYLDEKQRLKPNVPYKMKAGMSFFLSSPKYTYVIIDE